MATAMPIADGAKISDFNLFGADKSLRHGARIPKPQSLPLRKVSNWDCQQPEV